MGTSTSFKGLKNKSALIPEWARENTGSSADETSPLSDIPPENGNAQPSGNNNPENPAPLNEQKPLMSWRSARTAMGRYTRGSGSVSSAGKAYTKAKGGSRAATASIRAGKASLQRLGAFLSDVRQHGLNSTFTQYGLGSLAGKDATTVFAEIADYILPPGNDFDEGTARKAIGDALEKLLNECVKNDNYDCLDQLSLGDITKVIEDFAAGYIYRKWLQELGICIEKNAITSAEAVRLEKEIQVFVQDAVHEAVQAVDPLTIDWNSNEAQSIIDSIYQDAYSFIEGEES